jgi:hypothetical protein
VSDAAKDVLGTDLTESEARLLEAYRALEALHADPDLAPTAKANVGEAIAALWQAVNSLALTDDRPDV